ncbi:MAG: endonuclease NucS [Albidovulum sp.]|nr:endonuclease NucS [Albidovulum sp.]
MQTTGFRAWLEQRGLKESSASTIVSNAKGVEKSYGDLDELYLSDSLADVLQKLSYSKLNEQSDDPNPSRLEIEGNLYNSLASYKKAVNRYKEYRDADDDNDELSPDVTNGSDGQAGLFGLERDLQAALRNSIKQLDPDLEIIDGGAERSVATGFIDITAQAGDGSVVVIELKAGTAQPNAVAQILGYMGDVASEESRNVRGILVAGEFHKRVRSAARVVPSLSLRSYRFKFEFESVDDKCS